MKSLRGRPVPTNRRERREAATKKDEKRREKGEAKGG
jgi:hypothetical protein